jgi:hypothetical protein
MPARPSCNGKLIVDKAFGSEGGNMKSVERRETELSITA